MVVRYNQRSETNFDFQMVMMFFYDLDNGFVTMNVLEMLLNLWEYGVEYSAQGMVDAVGAMMDHQDKNSLPSLPKFSFWAQEKITTENGVTGFSANPANIANPLRIYKTFNGLINAATKMLILPENIRDVLNIVNDFSTVGGAIFSIPPDADDTGCALGVAAKLFFMMKSNYLLRLPAFVYFRQIRDEMGRDLEPYLKYAYRPYSDDVDQSVIDPRTYHWIRHFLHERGGNVDLITTWFQRISDIPAEEEFQKMPFSVNNVDGSVVVNGLYGIISTIFENPDMYILHKTTTKLCKLIVDSLDLVQHILTNDLIAVHAPSILLYYPSRFAFYYFVSRLCKLLEDGVKYSTKIPYQLSNIISRYRKSLRLVMQTSGTDQLMALKKNDISSGTVFWDDFLGNGDKIPNYDDRVFSTSMAFNALINTWTESMLDDKDSKRLRYVSNVPQIVVDTIEKAGRFLTSREADRMPQENAFFSASVKDQSSLPFFGVTNYRKSVDGLHSLECTDSLYKGIHYVLGVKGLMSEIEYEQRSKAGCFNMSSANPDVDYNR
jgi:hypothetical protein